MLERISTTGAAAQAHPVGGGDPLRHRAVRRIAFPDAFGAGGTEAQACAHRLYPQGGEGASRQQSGMEGGAGGEDRGGGSEGSQGGAGEGEAMKKKKLLAEIEELKARIIDLEAENLLLKINQRQVPPSPIPLYPSPYDLPWWDKTGIPYWMRSPYC